MGASASGLRRDLADRRNFPRLRDRIFGRTATTFWHRGYCSLSYIRDMDARERELLLQILKKGHRVQNNISGVRLVWRISDWPDPQKRDTG